MTQASHKQAAHRSSFGSFFAEGMEGVRVSFEFFPPKNGKMEEGLWQAIKTLESLAPEFVSVTYGAGGSTRERTHRTVTRILRETALKPAAHLTCVDASRQEIDQIAERYWQEGVRHIVALRGDSQDQGPYRAHPEGYQNAAELVGGLKDKHDFDISVAAYPEKHPDSPHLAGDLDNLKRKLDRGANRAITQFFFEADRYFRFLDHCTSYGIDVPVVPGILPVTNFKALKSFAARCGADLPAWLGGLFEGLDDRPETRALVAASVAGELCRKLYRGGVRHFHFYTLNRAELVYAICHMLGLRPADFGGSGNKEEDL